VLVAIVQATISKCQHLQKTTKLAKIWPNAPKLTLAIAGYQIEPYSPNDLTITKIS